MLLEVLEVFKLVICEGYLILQILVEITVISYSCHCHVTVLTQSCHNHVTVMTQSCHSLVAVMSQSCHSLDAVMTQLCRSHVAVMSQLCHSRVAIISQSRSSHVAVMSQSFHSHVTVMSQSVMPKRLQNAIFFSQNSFEIFSSKKFYHYQLLFAKLAKFKSRCPINLCMIDGTLTDWSWIFFHDSSRLYLIHEKDAGIKARIA